MTAQEVSASPTEAADFDDAPELRDALFVAGDCETTDGRQVCRTYLRGAAHERPAARFMARNGVRCPFRGGESDAFVAEHERRYYEVTCTAVGD